MAQAELRPGQRYASTAEPELGLGTFVKQEGRQIRVLFATAGVVRVYAIANAPLERARFDPGDAIAVAGERLTVDQVSELDGLYRYHCGERVISESDLDDQQLLGGPDQKLASAQFGPNAHFELRIATLDRRARSRGADIYGYAGNRVDLLTHQLRVASATADRRPPRVLLADEVGLGKTIECGLVLARLIATGRVNRVLILVPESLVHQWFVELLRRFHLQFAIYDEERCEAIQLNDPQRNPFTDEQLILTDLAFLTANRERAREALRAGFDLVVIDEAHHLEWTPEATSAEYALVEALSQACEGLMLLTATPEQLGRAGHYARLRLLDPNRYPSLEQYIEEQSAFRPISDLAGRLHDAKPLSADDYQLLRLKLGQSDASMKRINALEASNDPICREALIGELIDRHGTGRVMFRHRRAQLSGFPARVPVCHRIETDLDETTRNLLKAEFNFDLDAHPPAHTYDYNNDPRLPALVELLEADPERKLLLICRTLEKVQAIEDALRTRSGARIARFHEQLTLVQRDRNAAFFAETEGAQALLCSEIGSEGRNFQFAHVLVLWDLPLDPDLLEQRIGRLDRIGQRHDIEVHYFEVAGCPQAVVARWYHEALGAFAGPVANGREITRRHAQYLIEIAERHARDAADASADLERLIAATRTDHEGFQQALAEGRDRLLELSSMRQGYGEKLAAAIAEADADLGFDQYVLGLFEHYGIDAEELADRSWLLNPEYLATQDFPGLKDGPQATTFDRAQALAREDLLFLRPEHPMVQGAMELLLGSPSGSAALLIDLSLPAKTALLECVYVLECVGDRELHADRFLPPTPLRVVIDSKLEQVAGYQADGESLKRAADMKIDPARYQRFLKALVPPMRKAADAAAEAIARERIDLALKHMNSVLKGEIERLRALAQVNPNVRSEEIEAALGERELLAHDLDASRIRLDAVRFVASRDFLNLR